MAEGKSNINHQLKEALASNCTETVKKLVLAGAILDNGYSTRCSRAITEGNVELLEFLLCNGVDFSHSSGYGDSPLLQAVQAGSKPVVDLFLRYGVPVYGGNQGVSPLYQAVCYSHAHLVEYLVESGLDVDRSSWCYSNCTPLHKAAEIKDEKALEITNILLSAHADVKATNSLRQTPLHLAALAGNAGVIRRLLECGADVDVLDQGGSSSLHHAAEQGYAACIKELCLQGAALNMFNNGGYTALHLAVTARQVNATKMLLRYKAHVNKESRAKGSRTALLEFIATCKLRHTTKSTLTQQSSAKINSEIEIIDSLRHANANLNVVDGDGNSVLHLCVMHASEELVDYFIQAGSNYMLVNRNAHTVLSLACSLKEFSIVVKLIQMCPGLLTHPNNLVLSTSPFVLLCKAMNFRCIRFLFEAGYRPNRLEFEEVFSEQQQMRPSLSAIFRYVESEISQPQTLLRQSRVALRNLFSYDLKRWLYKSDMPQKLREDALLQCPFLLYS